MDPLKENQYHQALIIVTSNLKNCLNFQDKFPEGSAQASLLRNRIKALSVAQILLNQNLDLFVEPTISKDDLIESLPPLNSIKNKCEKAMSKSKPGSSNELRLSRLIFAMNICIKLINEKL
ncbi:MAG: hypothetical protein HGB31_09440 [Erysipelotrichaceae bacterium]|nr:hypothetical protein [Erysipelotrichaceae bacterium]